MYRVYAQDAGVLSQLYQYRVRDWRSENVCGATLYNWKGGYEPYYGPSWPSAKRKARERDKHICQRCGVTREELGKNLDVHHKIPFRNFGVERHLEANALGNLICHCARCHKIVEDADNPISKGQSNAEVPVHRPLHRR